MVGIPSVMMNQNFNNRLEIGKKAEQHFYNLFIQNNILAYISYGQSEVGDIWLPNLKSNIGKGFYLELKTKLMRWAYPDTGFDLSVAKNYWYNFIYGIDTLIVFIDKQNGIYGNFVSNLFNKNPYQYPDAKSFKITDLQEESTYPRCEAGILYFHKNSFENLDYLKRYLQLKDLDEQELLKQI